MKAIFLYTILIKTTVVGATLGAKFVVYSIVTIILFLLLFAFFSWRTRKRVERANNDSDDLKGMMEIALDQTNYVVIEYDVTANSIRNVYGNKLPDRELTFEEILSHIHPDDRDFYVENIKKLTEGVLESWDYDVRWKPFDATDGNHGDSWLWTHGHSLIEERRGGKVKTLAFTVKNVTEEREEETKAAELANRFKNLFESTIIAMSFYDKNGILLDLNEHMRTLCGFDAEGEKYYHSTCLFDFPQLVDDFDPQSREHFYVCQHMRYGDDFQNKYIEFRVKPTYENDELLYYVVTGRDVTAERKLYLDLYRQETELKANKEKRNQYEAELKYLLENSQTWVWRSDLQSQRIFFSRSLRKDDYIMSFKEFLSNIYDDQLPQAMQAFGQMEGIDANFKVTLHFKRSVVDQEPQWVFVTGIPVFDEKTGKLKGHFGIVRDVTALMEAQEKLRIETSRAENSGKLKSVFLANMTHEIRTPLNAIVGFSDLLHVIDSPEERHEFLRIIRNNCDMLMRLIDDIIEVSNINQKPLSIEAADVDFAVAFNDICQTLSQRVQEPGVEFVVDNPYKTFLTHVDKGRLQQVITNFTTNAVKYTQKGHIKVGYRYEDGGIYMYCEDTGAGIPKEMQSTVFERFVKLNDFVQGTGLGLSICKSIAERCNGRIGVMSEGEGCGSTFWIWIPCECRQSVLREESI